MRVLRGLESFPSDLRPSVTALGVFDGVHLGHAKILRRGRRAGPRPRRARRRVHVRSPPRRHPSARPRARADRLARGEPCPDGRHRGRRGPDHSVHAGVLEGGGRGLRPGYARRHARRPRGGRRLQPHVRARGARDACPARSARPAARLLDPRASPLELEGQAVSSSAIREALRAGDVTLAARLLGHPYRLSGTVSRGAGRGRTIGVPTANLRPDRPLILAPGVYAARASWEGAHGAMPSSTSDTGRPSASTSTGSRPTSSTSQGDLYDKRLSVDFLSRIRAEMKFPSVDVLKRPDRGRHAGGAATSERKRSICPVRLAERAGRFEEVWYNAAEADQRETPRGRDSPDLVHRRRLLPRPGLRLVGT